MIVNGNLKFHTLGDGELQNAVMENMSAAQITSSEAASVKGQMAYDTTNDIFYYSTGAAWVAFGTGGGVGAVQAEVDLIEVASGGIFDTDGTFGSTQGLIDLNAMGNISGLTGAHDLLDVFSQLDIAISNAAGVDTLGELTDVTLTAPADTDLLQLNGSGQWVNVAATSIGEFGFKTINGDSGSAVADVLGDTLGLVGATSGGVTTVGEDTGDTVSFALTPTDLATTSATLVGGDFLIVSDSADASTVAGQKTTITKLFQDLDVVSGISTDGIVTRIAADTYASRSIAASVVSGDQGISIVDGDGIAGDPTIGLDIVGLTANAAVISTDLVVIYDGTDNEKATVSDFASAIGDSLAFGGLVNVTDTSGAANVFAYTTAAGVWATAAAGATSGVQEYGEALDDFNVIGATTAIDQMYYSTAAGVLALTTVTTAARALLDDATVADQRTTLGLVAGGTGDIWVEKAGDAMTDTLNMGSNLITGVATPVSGTDATNKTYVDNLIAGLSWKNPALAASTANIVLATGGLLTIDGVGPLTAGDRVLVKDQTDPTENGIYLVASGAWTRSLDMDSLSPLDEFNSAAVFVQQGTLNSDIGYTVTSDVVTVGTDDVVFAAFTGAASVVDGVGLLYSGNVLNVNLGSGIAALPSDEVGIDLFDAATGALILTSSGTDRTTLTGSALHLLLGTAGGLEQDANGLRVDVDNATVGTIVLADSLLFGDADIGNVTSKTTVTDFLSDLNITTSSTGGVLTASNGVELTTNDFAVSIDSLTNTNAVIGADLIIFDDGASGTNGARTFANMLADLNVVHSLGPNGIAIQTSANVYVSRSVVPSVASGDEGVSVVNGNGVSGDITVGLDIVGLTAEAGTLSQTDTVALYDGVNNVKASVADLATAIGGVTSTDELEDVTAAGTVAGQVLVADPTTFDYTPRVTQFVATKAAAATTWTVTHSLNQKFVNVTVYDSADSMIIPQSVVLTSASVTTITFNTAITGTVVISGIPGLASTAI